MFEAACQAATVHRDSYTVLHVHRAERADALVEALRALLLDPLDDPFAPEVVAVPTRGMERWLTQRMSARLGASPGRVDGVCANVEFPSPWRMAVDAVAAASGIDPDADAWLPERAVWPLLEVVDTCLDEPWLRVLAAHLGRDDEARAARRFSTVRHLADLFDRYALHRPEMVRGWARGNAPDLWQAELWRRLDERIAQPDPAERLAGACQRLREEPDLVELPRRVSLFGLTRLPAAHLDVLRACSCCTPRRHCGVGSPTPSPSTGRSSAATPTPPPPCRRTACSPRGATTRARCSSCSERAT